MNMTDLGRPREGVMWMVLSGLSFVGVNGIVRYLGTDLPAAQSAFLRFAFGVALLAPVLPAMMRGMNGQVLKLFAWRGAMHTIAVLFWFYAMARIPVAHATAIGYLNPVLMLIAGAVILHEAFSARRIIAVAVALVGALIVLRPGVQALNLGHLSQIGASVFFCASYLFAKRLTGLASASVIVAMMSVTVTIGLAPLAWWVWVPVSWAQLGWLAIVAGCATSGHYCMTRAFRAAPFTVTQPVTFLTLVWATALGAILFNEAVDVFVLLGGAMIIGAITFVTWRDAVDAAALRQD
ncbi:DMT family transporter [Cypionkella sp.]|uniref:DMT family transporter n=1 Tax=Cypionkella sp. TaxID=2811411 RepID=UPI002AC8A4CC|nr:DMT family transporter [Cypionkella sp.]